MSVDGRTPIADLGAWVAGNATVVGNVRLHNEVGIWFGAVLRADTESITIGPRTNVQDGCVLHADPGYPLTVGAGVSVGHRAVLHGCTIEDDVLVGMGAIVLNGARIGHESLIGAGALVPQGVSIPPGSLVLGSPARTIRETSQEERDSIRQNAQHYQQLITVYRASAVVAPSEPHRGAVDACRNAADHISRRPSVSKFHQNDNPEGAS